MTKTKHFNARLAVLLCTAILGGTAYGQLSVSVGVEIRAQSDFYEPLTPYGRWEVVGSYGRCWIPARVEADWRPYSQGYWQRTEAGWYWVSDEPWAWATYHYGRWDLSPQFGWYWVPQTQWAPAWVSWHSGGGYIGWAPLYPSARFASGGSLEVDVRVISPRAYVFVEERHFTEPVSRSTVIVNNTTIINKTVNITNTKIVNNTVINEGPATATIEKASGRKIQAVAVQEVRQKQEAPVVARQHTTAPALDKKATDLQTPVRSEVQPRVTKAAAPAPPQTDPPLRAQAPIAPAGQARESEQARPVRAQADPKLLTPRATATKEPAAPKITAETAASSRVEKPGLTPAAPPPLTPTGRVRQSEKVNPTPAQAEPRPQTPRPAATKEPTGQKADKQPVKQEKSAQPPARNTQRPSEQPAREKPAASEKPAPEPTPKDHENKPKE